MSRADAWSDARDIYTTSPLPLWELASEVAMRTSLTKDDAEGKIATAIVAEVGELLFKFGDYGKAVDDERA